MTRRLLAALGALSALYGAPALLATPAIAAPPTMPAPAPATPGWTGFYAGVTAGWGDNADKVSYSPNDTAAANLLNGMLLPGGQPIASTNLRRSGAVGGFEAGYNWQVGASWIWGIEADFSFSGVNGQTSATSLTGTIGPTSQTIDVQQNTDWFGTMRARLGWLATTNLLLFGTGGFAYGSVTDSANLTFDDGITVGGVPGFSCTTPNQRCFVGYSTSTRTGWSAGGGFEWLVSDYVSLKAEYQFVDLDAQTVTVAAVKGGGIGTAPSSFGAAFRDQIQVGRIGLNFHL
jgi:outer membrane immunogenic protein